MTDRARSFGAVAADYERFRLGYPDCIVDEIVAYAGRPITTALEVGAGTGKATRVFAEHGIAVTATDPDPAMLAELRRHVPGYVVTIEAAFERLSAVATYDLVFAAASLHWTEATSRWSRVAALLNAQGVFASFGGPLHLADDDLAAAMREARATYLEDDAIASPDGTPADGPLQWPGSELVASELFTDVRQLTIDRRVRMQVDDYLGHLSTISAYLQLPNDMRRRVLDAIRVVLPSSVELTGDLTLHLARCDPNVAATEATAVSEVGDRPRTQIR